MVSISPSARSGRASTIRRQGAFGCDSAARNYQLQFDGKERSFFACDEECLFALGEGFA
uniref:Uncharacterized protein n=1 Tax=Cucumis melo TaxID=3656 RepID=A0A9I9CFY1_CUCME